MVLGDDVSTLQTFVWILNHVSRSNLVSIHPKSMKLGPMTNHNVIFHMVGSIYRLVTIRNSPQFPNEFQNGLLSMIKQSLIYSQGGGGGGTPYNGGYMGRLCPGYMGRLCPKGVPFSGFRYIKR